MGERERRDSESFPARPCEARASLRNRTLMNRRISRNMKTQKRTTPYLLFMTLLAAGGFLIPSALRADGHLTRELPRN